METDCEALDAATLPHPPPPEESHDSDSESAQSPNSIYEKFPFDRYYCAPEPTDMDYDPTEPMNPLKGELIPTTFIKGTTENRDRARMLESVLFEVGSVLAKEYADTQAEHELLLEEYDQVSWNMLMLDPKLGLEMHMHPLYFPEEARVTIWDKVKDLGIQDSSIRIMHSRNFQRQQGLLKKIRQLEPKLVYLNAKLREFGGISYASALEEALLDEDKEPLLNLLKHWRKDSGHELFPVFLDALYTEAWESSSDSDESTGETDTSTSPEAAFEESSESESDANDADVSGDSSDSDDASTLVDSSSGSDSESDSDTLVEESSDEDSDSGGASLDNDDSDDSDDSDGGAPLHSSGISSDLDESAHSCPYMRFVVGPGQTLICDETEGQIRELKRPASSGPNQVFVALYKDAEQPYDEEGYLDSATDDAPMPDPTPRPGPRRPRPIPRPIGPKLDVELGSLGSVPI
ncbi:Fc.00g042770.m01.CDS01 [Cosmosporella sp. VM-42]